MIWHMASYEYNGFLHTIATRWSLSRWYFSSFSSMPSYWCKQTTLSFDITSLSLSCSLSHTYTFSPISIGYCIECAGSSSHRRAAAAEAEKKMYVAIALIKIRIFCHGCNILWPSTAQRCSLIIRCQLWYCRFHIRSICIWYDHKYVRDAVRHVVISVVILVTMIIIISHITDTCCDNKNQRRKNKWSFRLSGCVAMIVAHSMLVAYADEKQMIMIYIFNTFVRSVV